MASKQEQIDNIKSQIKVLQDELKELEKIPDAPKERHPDDEEEHHADRKSAKSDR